MGGTSPDLLQLSSYQFPVPDHLIAQYPPKERGDSRLMVVRTRSQTIEEMPFSQITQLLQNGDHLVVNDTKVIPARLFAHRATGGKIEFLLSEPSPDGTWEVLAKPAKKARVGERFVWADDFSAEVIGDLGEGKKRIRFVHEGSIYPLLEKYGEMPLPHYIQRKPEQRVDTDRYQTVYAENQGAVAAPTAGLHFTETLLAQLADQGVQTDKVTLHVGLGTFRPVTAETVTDHTMQSERVIIPEAAANSLNGRALDRRVIAVGTTSCRSLESAADVDGVVHPGSFATDLFIYPGYPFKFVRNLLTNFHLPGSTLLMLVSALAGYDLMREAYAQAVEREFRFFSYGDAMLILDE